MNAPTSDTRPLRVLHVIDSLCRGGAESMLVALLQELGRHPEVHSVVRAGRREEADPDLSHAVIAAADSLAFLRSEHVYDPRFAVGLARTIVDHDIDVVHSHLAVASVNSRLVARALRRPHITSIHTMPGSTLTDTRAWLLADSLTARLSDVQIAPSEDVAGATAAHHRLARDRFRVIPNAPAAAAVHVDDRIGLRRELFGAAAGGPVVLCVARLVPGKGIDELLAAATVLVPRMPALTFLVAGAGPEHERLEASIEARGLAGRFRLLGHRSDVGRLLAAADVFCLPSHHEAAPISLLEAMNAGCVCVASAVGGIPEILEGGASGLLVAPGDTNALVVALDRVLTDHQLSRALAIRAGAAVAERYSIEVVTAQYLALYRELVAPHR